MMCLRIWGKLMSAARRGEELAGRFAPRGPESIRATNMRVTDVDRTFGFVMEKRQKCRQRGRQSVSCEAEDALKLRDHARPGGR